MLSKVTATFMAMTKKLARSIGFASYPGGTKELGNLTPFGLRRMTEGVARRACLKAGNEVGYFLARLCDSQDSGAILKVELDKGLCGSKVKRTWNPHKHHFERLFAGAAASHRPVGQRSLGDWAQGA